MAAGKDRPGFTIKERDMMFKKIALIAFVVLSSAKAHAECFSDREATISIFTSSAGNTSDVFPAVRLNEAVLIFRHSYMVRAQCPSSISGRLASPKQQICTGRKIKFSNVRLACRAIAIYRLGKF